VGRVCQTADRTHRTMKLPRGYSHPVKIGRGAFSTVYRAYQRRLERNVALKTVPLHNAGDAVEVEREARVLASINLQCLPRIFDICRTGKTVVIVMEWIRGVPLSSLIERGLSERSRHAIAGELIHAVALLHGNNIVHRDLKPQNVIVTPERGLFLVDFGFSSSQRTSFDADVAALRGTPAFMAPELWVHQEGVDFKKADLYSLGVTLQRLFAAGLPDGAKRLLQSDPALRPANCATFERDWLKWCPHLDLESLRSEITGTSSEYTARLLLDGACDLYGHDRREEAYALLVESLDIWPDNPEALAFLRTRFSLPIGKGWRRRLLAWSGGMLVAGTALVGAYISGVRSIGPRIAAVASPIESIGEHRLSLPVTWNHRLKTPETTAALRHIAAGGEPAGSAVVILPGRGGMLFVDGQPIGAIKRDRVTLQLSAGTRRVEWFDSAAGRRFGETIDLRPFSLRTIALRRFVDGK